MTRTDLLTEEYLKACRRDAEQYAQFCFRCLVDRYEADPTEIDFEDIVEGTLGYLMICIFGNERPMIPDKYVEMDLAKRSDFGLENMGLTREQYDKVLEEVSKLEIKILETEGDIQTIEGEIIPDIQGSLDYLTSPDYDPADNADHELRDADIEHLSSELNSERGDLYALKNGLKRLQARMSKSHK